MKKFKLYGWLIIIVLLVGCGKAPRPTVSPTGAEIPTQTQPAKPTTTLPVVTEEIATETIPPTEPVGPPWILPILAEEDLSRTQVIPEEQLIFDSFTQAIYVPNDPISLAVAIKGIPGPIEPVVASETPPLSEGAVQNFWIHNSDTNTWSQIEARLERVTDHAYLWFDTGRDMVDKEAIYDASAQAFESMYENNRSVFGSEWNPGIDGDPHVYIVHAKATAMCNVTEATAHQCGILGYFSSLDELPVAVEPHSNQHEMFVMNVDAGGIGGERYLLTLVHEFRHMIEYNYDRHDDDWEVEGTAMLAEDLFGYQKLPGTYGTSFTESGTDLQLNAWSQGNTIPHYGKGYVFSRYIYHRLGADAFSAWVQHPMAGILALDDVLQEYLPGTNALDLWIDWTAALALIDLDNVPEQYSFGENFFVEPPDKTSVNSFPKEIKTDVSQFGFDIFDIRSKQVVQVDFTGTTKVAVIEKLLPASGSYYWWSGRANQSDISLTREFDLSGVSKATLNYAVFYGIEKGYDFAYVLVSTDNGQTWQALSSDNMQGDKPEDDPSDVALTESFYTGRKAGWVEESIDLSSYAGKKIQLRFQYITDAIFTAPGLALDNISIPEIGYYDNVETSSEDWVANGFLRVNAYIPQRFHLLLITFDENNIPVVQKLSINNDNTSQFEIQLNKGSNRAFLIVAASNPLILTPANYLLLFK